MTRTRTCLLLLGVAVLGTLLSPIPVSAQDEYEDWTPSGVDELWTNDDNWTFAGELSGAPGIAIDRGARINSGTVIIDSDVDSAGVLLGSAGTIDIQDGSSLRSDKSDFNSGRTSLGGALRIAGGASFTGPNVTASGSLELLASTAGFEATGDLTLSGEVHLNIAADGISNLKVGGAATIGGTFVPTFDGVTPAFGDSFEFLNGATSVETKRTTVALPDSVTLDRGLRMRVDTTDNSASITVGNAPILQVDRTSGASKILNVVGDPVAMTGYAIGSELGLLNPEGFTGIGADGWTLANPAATGLGELNITGELSIEINGSIELGNAYKGGATDPTADDVTFEFSTPDGNVVQGFVEYVEGGGPGPDLQGDIDGNGTVEFADFLILSNEFGNTVDPAGCCGDIDGNGIVEFADFLVMSNNFGQSSGTAAAAVPEPASLSLLLIGLLATALPRRDRRT